VQCEGSMTATRFGVCRLADRKQCVSSWENCGVHGSFGFPSQTRPSARYVCCEGVEQT
jgi:hypothetical protein